MSFFRWLLWSVVLRGFAGLRVYGTRPHGPCVVVANHTSHADTPALLAALGPGPVVVLAAADYWTGWRRTVCGALAAGVPVRRHGGGSQDLEPVKALLAQGYRVVVFPEGTRSPSSARSARERRGWPPTGVCHSSPQRSSAPVT